MFFAFVDLEKAFDRVPRKVLWWAMRKVGVEEWTVRLVQAMYNNTCSRMRVGSEYSDEFEVGVGVHQGSVLSPLLFSCDQAALQMVFSVCPSVRLSVCLSVCLSHLFDYVPIIVSSWNFQGLLPMTKVRSMQKVKVRGQRSRSQRSQPNLTVSGL